MDDAEIKTLVARIARRAKDGGATVERATLLAEGSDVDAIEAWIGRAGGTPEHRAATKSGRGGLWAERSDARDAARQSPPLRYVLPPGALDWPPAAVVDRAASERFYAVGRQDDGPPGERSEHHPGSYGALLLDPDGTSVEFVGHRR